MENFQTSAKVCKVDSSLGLVFGWALICKDAGQDYFDLQGHNATEDGMLSAASDFMQNSRAGKSMHDTADGEFVFAFPLTTEIAKAFGITTQRTGLMVAMKPAPETLAKFVSGEYTGFSIGGAHIELVDEVTA